MAILKQPNSIYELDRDLVSKNGVKMPLTSIKAFVHAHTIFALPLSNRTSLTSLAHSETICVTAYNEITYQPILC